MRCLEHAASQAAKPRQDTSQHHHRKPTPLLELSSLRLSRLGLLLQLVRQALDVCAPSLPLLRQASTRRRCCGMRGCQLPVQAAGLAELVLQGKDTASGGFNHWKAHR